MIIDINMDSYEYLQTLCNGYAYDFINGLEEDERYAYGEDMGL